ncbi:hypothetical protein PV646_20990 [Streptomyces sp. ID05-26A]|nr:hypothetical protein [Streptomyces sp. ID05-26A]
MAIDDRVRDLYNRARSSPAARPSIVHFAPDRLISEPVRQSEILPRRDYFSVTVNELFLSHQRKWFTKYDPMVCTVVEFEHDSQSRAVPFLVGPQLIRGAMTDVPAEGVVFADTTVAGPHPAKGERLVVTTLLCQIEMHDYVRGLLKGIERVAGAADVAGLVGPAVRIAESVLDGVDDVLGSGSTQLLAGLRHEFRLTNAVPSPSYWALIADPEVDPALLWVRAGRLVHGDSADTVKPYRGSDFTLMCLRASPTRLDVDQLPFHSIWQQAKREAARSVDKDTWERRGRAALFTLAEAIYDSPDLTIGQQDALIADYEERAIVLRDEARRRAHLGPGELAAIDARPGSSRILEL